MTKPATPRRLGLLRAGEQLVLQGAAESIALEYESGGQVEFVDYDETLITLRVESPAPAYLVLNEALLSRLGSAGERCADADLPRQSALPRHPRARWRERRRYAL